MARISDAELERLKRDVSVQRLAEAAGVELKKHGADLIGRCCFHEDKTPSLVVSPTKNLWHCLGACQAGGSCIDWVMKAKGVSFRHAVELLRADVPAPSSTRVGIGRNGAAPAKMTTVRALPSPVQLEAGDAEALRQVVDYYHQTLKQSPEALAYLEKRGLRSSEMVEHFRLGFSNRTLGLRLPMKNRDAGAAIRGRLQKLGLLRESGHEHFTGSLVIPVIDEAGNVTEMYGRKITPGLRPGTPLHLYLPGPHQGVWNVAALAADKSVILCEALIDALTFWCAGFRNVTSSYGVEGFTADHLAAFKKAGVEKVLIAYDRDDAGDAAAEKLASRLLAEGFDCFRVQFPRGMDANEYALKVSPAEKSLGLVLRQALWMGKGARPDLKLAPSMTPEPKSAPSLAAEAAPLPSKAMEILAKLGPEAMAAAAIGVAIADVSMQDTARPSAAKPRGAPAAPLAASTMVDPPASPSSDVTLEVKEEEVVVTLGNRRYRVRGLAKNLSYDSLKVNVLVAKGEAFHVDTLEMYAAKARAAYVHEAARELGVAEDVLRHDLGHVLLRLEELQEKAIKAALEPKQKAVLLTEGERSAALELLKDEDLLGRILRDFERCGVVGEETNKLVGYLAAVSRKLEEPLAVVIQSSSAAGKTSLMEAVLAFVPEEERVKYSAMTGQSLFYMGEMDLKHKVLAVVEEEGASRAAYALKLLQSEGELTIASTGKDPTTGKLVTHEYRVEGPTQLFLTTTAIELDEELLNRCVVLTVDEEREQTKAIHRLQRERQTLEGLLARREKDSLLKLHRDAQRLLRPLLVANPYARELTFVDDRTRTRRDFMKYLTLIRTVALLHQYQRVVKTVVHQGQGVQYIEVTREDIAVANRLAHQVLGRSLDELPPQTRRLLMLVDQMVASACERLKVARADFRFSRREVREATGWSDTQLKVHLGRLAELEYLVVHRGQRGNSFVYELAYDGAGKDGTPFLSGLINPEKLAGYAYDVNRSGVNGQQSGSGRPSVGHLSGGSRGVENGEFAKRGESLSASANEVGEKTLLRAARETPSYAQASAAS